MFVSFAILVIVGGSVLIVNWRSLLTLRRVRRGFGVITCLHLALGIALAAYCQVGTDGMLEWQLAILLLAVTESIRYMAPVIMMAEFRQPSWEIQSVQPDADRERVVTGTFEGVTTQHRWKGR